MNLPFPIKSANSYIKFNKHLDKKKIAYKSVLKLAQIFRLSIWTTRKSAQKNIKQKRHEENIYL